MRKKSSYENSIICGDINIDITFYRNDNRSFEYLIILAGHCDSSAHTMPIHGHTCLDHIIIKTKLEITYVVIDSSETDCDSVGNIIDQILKLSYYFMILK